MSQTMGQVTPLLIAESPVSQSTEVASYQTCDQNIAPPFPRLNEFLFGYVYFMTVCHMVRDSLARNTDALLEYCVFPLPPPNHHHHPSLALSLSPRTTIPLPLQTNLSLRTLQTGDTHALVW